MLHEPVQIRGVPRGHLIIEDFSNRHLKRLSPLITRHVNHAVDGPVITGGLIIRKISCTNDNIALGGPSLRFARHEHEVQHGIRVIVSAVAIMIGQIRVDERIRASGKPSKSGWL